MQISKEGLIELANYEALAHTKYLDSVGVHTIGIGMTISEIPDLNSWSWTKSLSTQECVDQYRASLKQYENAVNRALKVEVTQAQYDMLVSITYNIGVNGMAGSTFMKRINAKDTPERIVSAMKAWNKANGRILKGLVNRRAAEGKVFLTGKYTNDGTIGLIVVNSTTHKPAYKGRINIGAYL